MNLSINGQSYTVADEPGNRLLLWVLRNELGLTGTKFGCGIAMCGSCTVLRDGQPTRTCVTPLSTAAGREIVTLEGLATMDGNGAVRLHPVQRAFEEEQVHQCGYCMTGQMLTAVSSLYVPLRQAGADMRQLGRQEGARQLGQPLEATAAEQGYVFVVADPSVRRSYGEIVAAAETLTPPEQPASLKSPTELRYIGQPMPRVDLRAKVLGQAIYGIDVRLPGMLYGAVAHPPTVEGMLKRAAAGTAGSMPGVVQAVIDEKNGFACVAAESREQAYAALPGLDLDWDPGHLWQQAEVEEAVTAGGSGGVVIRKEGTVRGRLRDGAAVEAEYRVPMAYHAHFEPMTGVADVRDGSARIYAGAILGHDFGAWRGARTSYSIANVETIAWVAELPFLTGWRRGLGLLPNTFALECFIDEIAAAAGVDPIELRLRHLPEGLIGERLRTALLAVANAVYALTSQRLRRLPLRLG